MKVNKPKLIARDIGEENRTATMLELFYDLIFVVAIANVAAEFHHAVANDHIGQGIISYTMIFFAIWWAWNQYTWFASTFDNGSSRFKLVTMWQMLGALLIAAGVEKGFNGDFTIIVIGYVVIRLSSIYLWLTVAKYNQELKVTAMRYAIGILLCQLGWIGMLFLEFSYFIFILLWLAEFSVPYYAESHTKSPYHSEHIEERFSLLTIIVLGESILASVDSLKELIEHFSVDLLLVAIGCILTLFGIWWLYFINSVEHLLRNSKIAFQWGYGHLIIFASAAAIGALISVNVDVITDHAHISITIANLAFSISVAIFLFGLWFCQERIVSHNKSVFLLLIAGLTVGLGFLPNSVFTIGLLIVVTAIFRQYKPISISRHH
jgi:low temperature requirement protein LtrA